MLRYRLLGAASGLPALFALWYLPSLGQLYWWREGNSYGASGDWASGDPAEILRALNPPNWSVRAVVASVLCALALGAALAASRRLPALGVAAGLPLAAVGAYALVRREDIGALARFLPLPGGPEVSSRQLREGTEIYLGQGMCLLVGGTLLAAVLWGSRTSRRSPWRPLPSAVVGLVVLVAAFGCSFDSRVWVMPDVLDTVMRVGLTAVAAILFGWLAAFRRLSPAAPLVCGVTALILGVDHLFSGEAFSGHLLLKLKQKMLSPTLFEDHYYEAIELGGHILAGGTLLVMLGGALVVAAVARLTVREPSAGDGPPA
ncbi:hypothetical protein ABGB12_12960 [Actinocorallia sp. B10E7]|uniref:hypothetical protein n=1 Tax=Actinocorallia sp. B10E7 TaxID=3153558 RepID=UPI00325CCEBB